MKKSLVLGFFDGVHKAHRAVIESVLNCSDEVTLLTFKESPALYFGHKAEYVLSRKDSVNKIKSLFIIILLLFVNNFIFSQNTESPAASSLENDTSYFADPDTTGQSEASSYNLKFKYCQKRLHSADK